MTTLKTFADELAAVSLTGVTTTIAGIPKELTAAQLPAKWADLPSATIEPELDTFGTLAAGAAAYTGTIYIAVAELAEGLPDAQRTAILDMAVRVEEWAIATPYAVTIETKARIPVGSREYRGVVAQVTAPDMA